MLLSGFFRNLMPTGKIKTRIREYRATMARTLIGFRSSPAANQCVRHSCPFFTLIFIHLHYSDPKITILPLINYILIQYPLFCNNVIMSLITIDHCSFVFHSKHLFYS